MTQPSLATVAGASPPQPEHPSSVAAPHAEAHAETTVHEEEEEVDEEVDTLFDAGRAELQFR